MEIVWVKVLDMLLLGLLAFVMGVLPLFVFPRLKSRSNGDIVLSCFLCFGCGVLLATVFTHLLPEVVAKLKEAEEKSFISIKNYPLGEVIVCCGFLLIYLLEEVAVTVAGEHVHGRGEPKEHRSASFISSDSVHTCSIHSHENTLNDGRTDDLRPRGGSSNSAGNESMLGSFKRRHRENSASSLSLHVIVDHDANAEDQTVSPATPQKPVTLTTDFRTMLVVLALSYHAIFEGLAVGLQDNEDELWLLTAAIMSHKLVIVFSVGMELLEEGVRKKPFIIYMSAFAAAMPLGILVGILVTYYTTEENAAGMLTVAVLQGVSGGTILYVAFCEVLERERNRPDRSQRCRYMQFFSLCLGFAVLAGLEAVGGHSHGGGHDDHASHKESVLPTEANSVRQPLRLTG